MVEDRAVQSEVRCRVREMRREYIEVVREMRRKLVGEPEECVRLMDELVCLSCELEKLEGELSQARGEEG